MQKGQSTNQQKHPKHPNPDPTAPAVYLKQLAKAHKVPCFRSIKRATSLEGNQTCIHDLSTLSQPFSTMVVAWGENVIDILVYWWCMGYEMHNELQYLGITWDNVQELQASPSRSWFSKMTFLVSKQGGICSVRSWEATICKERFMR